VGQNLGQQEMGQNLQQQLNQWDPWPEQIMAQQQPQQGFNLNDPAQGPLVVGMDMDLNLDPLEVIINPVDPPNNNGIMELNELIQEIGAHTSAAAYTGHPTILGAECHGAYTSARFPCPPIT